MISASALPSFCQPSVFVKRQKYHFPLRRFFLEGNFSFIFLITAGLLLGNTLLAQTNFFTPVSAGNISGARVAANQVNNKGIFRLNEPAMRTYLQAAPIEFRNNGQHLPLQIPLPNGTTETFNIVESPILSPAVAAAHPEIKTYTGNGTNNKRAVIRLSLTSSGFNAIILNVQGDAVYFENYAANDRDVYFNYFTKDVNVPRGMRVQTGGQDFIKNNNRTNLPGSSARLNDPPLNGIGTGTTLTTFRLALAGDHLFVQHNGGTVSSAFNVIVAYVNRVNAFYRNELSVGFTLVSGTNLVFADANTDPYNNVDQDLQLSENQSVCDNLIGSANYDIGHVMGYIGVTGGGLAALGSVCNNTNKAQGLSFEGDPDYVTQVINDKLIFHEIGHQFGMTHSYNSTVPVCTSREIETSVEPGAGITVMSYAMICFNNDFDAIGDDYYLFTFPENRALLQFHNVSYQQAVAYIQTIQPYPAGVVVTNTGNTPPVVTVPFNFTIPKSTPFALTGSATDANGDALTYCWEGTNTGGDASNPPDATTLTDPSKAPFSRTYAPATTGTRIFPVLDSILNGSNHARADKLPSVSTDALYNLTVRDNNPAGGGVSYGSVVVTVNGAIGPFLETTNLSGSYAGNSVQTITWSVNGTNTATPNVKISLSTDGGLTFPTVLLASTANDGSQSVTLPNITTTTARIKVESVGNIFFDISNSNFAITLAVNPTVDLSVSTGSASEAGVTVVTVTATTSAPVSGAQTVSLGVSGSGITAGDYNLSNTTITIPDLATTGSVTFTVVDDILVEGTETAVLTISSPSAGITLGAVTTQNIVITDNDPAGPIIVVSGGAGLAPSYTSLTNAGGLFAALNATSQAGQSIVIAIAGDVTTEAGTNALTGAAGVWTSLTISPSGGVARTISGTVAAPLIDFNGADNVTIDGLNTGGNSLTISNLSTSATAGTSTIRFINDATINTINKCTISGSATGGTTANIFFSTTTGATGNDGNVISNNNIGPAGANLPLQGIFSVGTTTVATNYNSGIQVTNNNIFDFFNNTASTVATGIFPSTGSSDWTITGNSLYQTATRTFSNTGTGFIGISVSYTSGNNFTVNNNFIGGSAASAGGGAWTQTGATTHTFIGIRMSVGTTTASNIQNNTIKNISISTSATSTINAGISAVGGSINIGTTTGNIIGSGTGTGSIIWTGAGAGAQLTGILAGTGTPGVIAISNNTIGSITVAGAGTTVLRGINLQGTGTSYTVSGNTIGSASTANSITTSVASTCAGIISSSGSTTVSITGNTIANITHTNATALSTALNGIAVSAASNTITGNTVRNLTSSSTATGTSSTAGTTGILMNSTSSTQNVSGNIVHSISNLAATAAVTVNGIYYAGGTSGTNIVERNFVHSLSASSTGSAIIRGIYCFNGSAAYRNNMIRLGIDAAGNNLTSGTLSIEGFRFDAVAASVNLVNFNSVYIGGTGVTTGTVSTVCYIRITTETTSDVRDNIFVNNRSNSTGTGKHYLLNLNAATGVASNYNVHNQTGTGALFGVVAGTDRATFALWKTNTGQDLNSYFSDPQFNNAIGLAALVDLHINPSVTTLVEGNGLLISPPTNDFDGQTRSGLTPVDIGADAGNFTGLDLSAPAITYTLLTNTISTANRTTSSFATITDASGVNVTAGTAPRMYYKKSSDANNTFNGNTSATTGWKYAESTTGSSPFDFTIDYSLLNNGPVVVGDVIQYFVVAQDNAGTPNVGINSGTFAATPTSVALTAAAFPVGGTINSYSILGSISGTITVPGTYTSLTNPGGAFAAINASVVTGNVTIEITGDLTGENGTVALNEFANPFTITIKPTGTAHSITGSSATSIITLNGADRVTINGSLGNTVNSICSPTATASRDITITNTNTGVSSAVVWLQTTGANGATSNTIMNCNIVGNSNTTTLFGIGSGSSTINSTSLGTGNNNNSFVNNNISKTQVGIYSQGASAANKNTGTIINQNLINTASPNNVQIGGIFVGFENNITISANNIANINSSNVGTFGIALGIVPSNTYTTLTGDEVTGATVSKNVINSIVRTGDGSSYGIVVSAVTSAGAASNMIANNMISGVRTTASTPSDSPFGIEIGGGATSSTFVYYNTISLSGVGSSSANCYGIGVGGTNPTIDIRNNIIVNKLTSTTGKMYALAFGYNTFTNLTSNNNDFFVTADANHFDIGTGASTLGTLTGVTRANWNASNPTKDGASLNIDPEFASATDLHINVANAINAPLNNGAATVSVTDDIDCNTRATDIGADEFDLTGCTGAVGGTASGNNSFCGPGTPAITATGYSTGTGSGYQWYSSTNIADYPLTGSIVSGQTNPAALTTGLVSTTTYYWLQVTCPSGTATAYSNMITVEIKTPVIADITPNSPTICYNSAITLTATPGGSGETYLWTPGGATTNQITVTPLTTTNYSVLVTAANGCSSTAGETVTVSAPPPTTTGVSVCVGGSGSLGASTCIGFVNSGTTITGAWTGAPDLIALRPATSISNSATCAFDATITRNYIATPFQVSVTGSYTFEMNNNASFDGMGYITSGTFVPGNCLGGGVWVKGDDDGGSDDEPLITASLTAGVTYTLISTTYSSTSGIYTGSFGWTITPPGGGVIMLQNTVPPDWYTTASGGSPIGSGISFNPVGVAGSTLTNTNTAGTTVFYAACPSNPDCRTAVNFVINEVPAITTGTNPSVCSGATSANLSYTINAGSPDQYTIDFDAAAEAQLFADVPYAANNLTASPIVITVPAGALAATYNALLTVKNSTTGCVSSSYPITVTVNALPTAIISGNNGPICSGSNAVFNLTGTSGATITYTINGGANQTVVLTGGTATVTINGAVSSQTLVLVSVADANCSQSLSGSSTVTVNALPTAIISGNNGPICSGSNAVFNLTGTSGATVTYSINGGGNQTVVLTGGTASVTITVAVSNQTLALVSVADANCSQSLSGSSTVTVNALPTAIISGNNSPICSGSNAVFNLTGTSGATVTYTINGGDNQTVVLTGGTATVTITSAVSSQTLALVSVADANCSQSLSGSSTVTVNALPTVNLSVNTNSASETAATVVTVTATASSAVFGSQTVSLGVSGSGITAGDYTLSNATITIPNGGTTGSVTFTIVDDAVFEGTETATLTISGPSACITLGAITTQNITITDNDAATANIAVLVTASSAVTANTTASVVELNTSTASQAGTSYAIPSAAPNGLRFSGSAGSTGYMANSDDGKLLCFNGANNTNTTANVNTLNPRGVGTFNSAYSYNLYTTYTGVSSNQTRCATTLDNANFFIADQGGLYSNGTTAASPSGNFRGVKSFGGTVYIATASSIGTIAALTGGTVTALPGLPALTNAQDFYLIQSGTNGNTYDILYVVTNSSGSSNTAGAVLKFSLVSGSWSANGSFTTNFGGFGLAAQKQASGAYLFVSTGAGALTANSVLRLTDAAGYNATVSITSANNITLYTAGTGAIIKGVAFAPTGTVPLPPVSLSVSTNNASEAGATVVTVTANAVYAVSGDQTVSLAVTGTNITAGDYTLPNATITIPSGATSGSVTFTIVDDAIFEGTETAILTISNPSAGILLGGPASQNIIITDNDNADNPSTIVLAASTTNYIDGGAASVASPYAVSGVISDPTDPAGTLGIDFTISDVETPVGSLIVTASSGNTNVVPNANLNLTGTGASRNLKITPSGIGFATITVSVNDGVNTTSYILNYAASAASVNTTTTRFHTGTSDASTAQAVDANYMFVADDENNIIRLYNRQNSGLPVYGLDVTSNLGLTDLSNLEVDIEGSVQIGNRIYWIGSHGNNKNGLLRPNRSRLFATDVTGTGSSATLSYAGRYDNLRTDLLNWDANNVHGLGANYFGFAASAAEGIIPEAAGGIGFNLEGLTVAPDGTTAYLCFRAPIEPVSNRTKALIVPVTNFTTLSVSGGPAGSAIFGAPIQLDLGGRGIREIKRNTAGQYLIVAGPYDDVSTDFRLYTWTGNAGDAPLLRTANLTALNAGGSFESIVELPASLTAGSQIQLLVDNGDAVYYGGTTIAKDLPNNNHKKFRSELIVLGCAAPSITGQPLATQTVCQNGTPANLIVTASGDGLTYQWYSDNNNTGFDGTPIGSATNSSYTPPTGTAGTFYYYVIVTGTCEPGAISGYATVIVNLLPTASIASNNPVCPGNNAVFNLNGTSGATVTYTINGGGNQTAVLTGGTAIVTITGVATNQTLALVSVTDANCSQSLSGSSTVTVLNNSDAPVVTSPICAGATSVSGTSSEANGTTITVYVNGSSVGTTAVSSNAWTKTGLTLAGGDLVKATAQAGGECVSTFSNTITVQNNSDAPVVTSPICAGATSVSGTSSEANGTTTTVYINGSSVGTTTVSSNAWTKTGLTLAGGDLVKATAQAAGECVSAFSVTITVQNNSDAPVVTSPICTGVTSVSGTSSEGNGTIITVYVNGSSAGTTTVTGNAWTKTGLTLATGNLVKATAQAPGECVSGFSNTVTVNPCVSNNANLSNLVLSTGALTPAFAPGTISYTQSVANNVTTTTVTPTAADAGATITVNGVPVTSGTPFGPISLNLGSNVITVVVTAQDGTTIKTYTVTVSRSATVTCESPAAQAYVSNTQTGNQAHRGELGMQFIVNSPNGILIKQLGAFDDGGTGITGLQPGGGIRVAIFNRTTHTIVSGLDVTISGLADAFSGNHRMVNITPVTLPPGDYVIVAKGYNAGERNGNSYEAGVPYAAGDNGGGAISFGSETLYGPDDPNGFNYPTNAGNFGNSPVYLAGTFVFTTTVSCGLSNNANLSNLALSQGTLTPLFTQVNTSYSAPVANSVTTITVTPTAANAGATITVNGVPVISGTPSGSIALAEGNNIITIVVTAQDGTTIKTYTVNVIRAAYCESAPAQAYISNITTGNQAYRGELGMQFIVNNPGGIIVNQLGAFDDGGTGITGLQPGGGVRVAIFNRTTHTIVPGLDVIVIGTADHYTGNHRMKDITPVTLPPGDYVIVAKGYHAGERNGNSFEGGGPYPSGSTGGGAISFGNETLYGTDDPNGFNYPATAGNFGNSPVYHAGTFNFTTAIPCGGGCESPAAQAYTANTTTGNQAHRGELGMQFIVNNPNGILIKQLGAFDDGGNGITGLQPGGGVRVAIFNRTTHTIVPGLDITVTGNANQYTGNHRMKDITPVILPPGDYVIVAKGYHAGERNGNSFEGGVPYPGGNTGGGAISFGNETSFGNDDPNGFNYPGFAVNLGDAHVFLAGTFNFTTIINCPPLTTRTTVTDPVKQSVKKPEPAALIVTKMGAKIYPNPTNGQFNVQLSDITSSKINIQVMNSNGRLVEQKIISLTAKTALKIIPFNLANQPAGLYIIKVESGGAVQTEKFVIQR